MLVDKIDPSIAISYEQTIRMGLEVYSQQLEKLLGDGSFQDTMNALDYAQKIQNTIQRFHQQLENMDSLYKPFVDKDTGEDVYGFFEMDERFVHHAVEDGFLTYPTGADYSYSTISGVAETLDEIQEHVAFLTEPLLNFRQHENYYKHLGFPTKDFIVWVEESDDYDLFHELIHVGKWGFDLFDSSGYAKVKELKKAKSIRKVNSIMSAENDALPRQNNAVISTMQFSHASDTFNNYIRDKNYLSTDPTDKYNLAYQEYRESHPAFLTFTLLATE